MNKTQFASFAMALQTYYPKEGLLPNEQAVNLWYAQLQDLDYKIAELVLNKWVATNKWAPTIADIRSEAADLISGEIPDWGEGWEQVLKAIGKFGMYRQSEALESMDAITRECVARLGFGNICISENISADRANFRTLYEAIAGRKKKEMQLPEATQKRLAAIRNALIEDKGGNDGDIL